MENNCVHSKYKRWEAQFQDLLHFREIYPNKWPTKSNSTSVQSNWVMILRKCYKEKKLPQNWIDKLNSIGFPFCKEKGWAEKHQVKLQQVVNLISSTNKPIDRIKHKHLSFWFGRQKNNLLIELNKDRPKYKEVKEFLLKYFATSFKWMNTYNRLLEFYKIHKRFPSMEEDKYLYSWVTVERARLKKNKRNPEQIKLLNDLNVYRVEESRWISTWDNKYEILKKFLKSNNHYPRQNKGNKKEHLLYNWIQEQRQQLRYRYINKPNKLSEDKVKKLKEINFYFCIGDSNRNKIYL